MKLGIRMGADYKKCFNVWIVCASGALPNMLSTCWTSSVLRGSQN